MKIVSCFYDIEINFFILMKRNFCRKSMIEKVTIVFQIIHIKSFELIAFIPPMFFIQCKPMFFAEATNEINETEEFSNRNFASLITSHFYFSFEHI